jgi:signal peptidase I
MNELKPRKPLMAALMSLILPGFGQLYNGDVNRGLLIFIGFTLCTIPLVVLIALFLPSSIMLPLLILATLAGIGLWIYGVGNAWQAAKKLGEYTLQSWQMPGAYLLIFLTAMLFILPSMTQYVRNNLVASYNIPSKSMEPSVLRGDVLFANRLYNCPQCYPVKPGDVAIFVYPNNRTQHYIKRIIALPGDKIEIGQQQVIVNGQPLSRGKTEQLDDKVLVTEKLGEHEYQVQGQVSDTDDMIELTVPSGQVFVLGDNRSASNDSLKFGTVPLQDVVGKASQIWFSKGEDGVRWGRLGELIE